MILEKLFLTDDITECNGIPLSRCFELRFIIVRYFLISRNSDRCLLPDLDSAVMSGTRVIGDLRLHGVRKVAAVFVYVYIILMI